MKNRLSAIIRRHSLTHRPLLAIAWTVCVVASPSASAADGSWNANAAGGWQDPANWLGGVIPDGVGDSAAFSLDINANRTISLNGDRTLGSLTIGDPTSGFSNFTLAAGTPGNSRLIFDQGAGATATLSYPVVSSTANNSLSVPVLLMGNLSITTEQTTTGNQTLSGIIADGAGSYGLSKSGPGILTLSALNNYKGGTTVNAGKVNANTFAALGSGAVGVSSGGQVHLAATNGAYRNAFTIAGTGFGITETNNTHLLGALRYANSLTSGSISVASGGARLGAANNAFGIHLGSLTGSGNLEINSPDTNHGGTILLAGPAAGYTATLTLARGTLKLAAPSFGGSLAAADGSRVFLDTLTTTGAAPAFGSHLTLGTAGGATVLVDPTATTPVTVSGNLSLGGSQTVFLTKPHSGVATPLLSYNGTLTGSATNLDLPGGIASYRAGTGFSVVAGSPNLVTLEMVSADRTWIAAGGDWNTNAETWATGTYANGDNVTFGDFDETSAAVTVNLASGTTVAPNSITFSNSAKSYTISGTGKITGTAAITKNGTGSAVISNTGGNDFAGGITVNDGSLYLVPSASLNVNRLTLTGGRLGATAALTLNANAGLSGSVTLGDSATGRTGGITVTGIHTVADGTTITVSNPVTAIFSGVTRLPASLTTATPFSTPNNGVLTFSGAIELSSDLAIDTTAAFNTSNFTNFNGSVNDGPASYKITKTGSGALRLSAPNNYDGGTDIEGGTIIAFHPAAFGSGPVTITNNGQANLGTGGTYPNAFSIRGLGQIVNGLSNTSPDGAIQLNTSNINLTGPITLTGDARIGGYLTTSNTILSGAISEDGNGPWLLEIGSPGAANGNGTITLTGTNTHTGGTKIQRVTLRAWGNDVFGTGQVEVNSGGSATLQNRLEINNSTIANDIVLDSNGRTHSTATTQTWGAITGYPGDNTTASTDTVSGRIDILRSVANGGHFAAQGHPANSILRVTGEVTASSGVPVTVAFGTVQFAGGGDYADLHHYQGTLLLAAANGLCQNAILTQGHQGASVFDLNGFNQTLAALGQAGSGAATVTNHGAG
ncbi:MAG: autotransporter-associated beta strand repeat-containing protein, partial [Akkermansiaceae bacterium]|nr:autotransporter-associated beta strand repeat-containing protein [Akkermansiaceae bacterium]